MAAASSCVGPYQVRVDSPDLVEKLRLREWHSQVTPALGLDSRASVCMAGTLGTRCQGHLFLGLTPLFLPAPTGTSLSPT